MSTDVQKETSHLPDELVEKIVEYIIQTENNVHRPSLHIRPPANQTTLANLCLLNKQWYRIAVTRLYARPWLYGSNYDLFVRTICTTNTFEPTRCDLAEFINELDLRLLKHQCSKTIIAGLIGHTKTNLEVFRAPRSVFGVNCLVALSSCRKLQVLDLSAINSPVNYWDFVWTLEKLPQLKSLDAPQINGTYDGSAYYPALIGTKVPWPSTLSHLRLSRMHPSNDLAWMVQRSPPFPGLPNTITMLVIQNGQFSGDVLAGILETTGPQLRDLTLTNLTVVGGFNRVLCYAKNLERLCISTNFINYHFPLFSRPDAHFLVHHPLQRLEVATCSGIVEERADKSYFTIKSLAHALDSGVLTNLRRVDVWKSAVPSFRIDDLECELMHDRLLILGSKEAGGYENAGLYTMDDSNWDGMVTLDGVNI